MITSCLPKPPMEICIPSALLSAFSVAESAPKRLGTQRTRHPLSSPIRKFSSGVNLSLPGQKGQFSLYSGKGTDSFLALIKSFGRFARSVARITHSRVGTLYLNSGISPPCYLRIRRYPTAEIAAYLSKRSKKPNSFGRNLLNIALSFFLNFYRGKTTKDAG
jgi:hypothetical protein